MLSAVAVPAVGAETLVNTQTISDQSSPVVAMDSSGDYVVAWHSNNQDGSGWGIYAQRFSAVGVAQGTEFRVNTTTAGDQTYPAIAMDSAGDFVITWTSSGQDGSGTGIYAQRYNAAGVAQGGEFRVNTFTTNDQSSPSVAMDASGDFVITWVSYAQVQSPYGAIYSIYAQRYNAAGVAQGSEFKVNSTEPSQNYSPAVAMDATGNFVITWSNTIFDNLRDPFMHIEAKRYNASGVVVQDQFDVTSGFPHGHQNPQIAMNASGQFAITWWGVGDDIYTDEGVAARLFDANGNVIGNPISVNTFIVGNQSYPHVATTTNGNFVITWQSNGQDGSGFGISAQQYNSTGAPIGSETRVNTTTAGDQAAPAVAMDAAGDLVVVWHGPDTTGNGVYSQLFLTTQTPLLLQIEGRTPTAAAPLFTPITSQLNVNDAINANWTGATISISGNYQSNQDVLSFTNTNKIRGTWNSNTGTLTLSGTATVAEYRTALRSVTYHNSSNKPNTALVRTVSFQTRAGSTLSNVITRSVNVQATSQSPIVTGTDTTVTFVSPTGPISIAPNLVVTEPDGLPILSATVTFTNWQGEDRLNFNNTLALQHTFVQDLTAHTATLTITGSAAAAGYQALLRSVIYQDVAGTPNTTAIRNATFTVNDQLHSASATSSIRVVNYLSGVSSVVNFTQGTAPLAIAASAVVTAPTGVNIQSATVTFTNWQAEDRLAFYNSLALQHSFTQDLTAHTATLTITGTASAAGYQTLLRSVTYQDVAGKPITYTRDAKITLNDGTTSVSAIVHVTVTAVNQAPLVQMNDSSTLAYRINGTAIPIMNLATITDADSNNLTSLTVQISSGYQLGKDVLSFVNQSGITGSFNATTGILTLSGSNYVGNYREALRAVKFNTTGTGVNTGTRTFRVIAVDDTNTSSNPVTRNISVVAS